MEPTTGSRHFGQLERCVSGHGPREGRPDQELPAERVLSWDHGFQEESKVRGAEYLTVGVCWVDYFRNFGQV